MIFGHWVTDDHARVREHLEPVEVDGAKPLPKGLVRGEEVCVKGGPHG